MSKKTYQCRYLAIAEDIKRDIQKGIYRDGTPIPPIRKLAELYDVSPQTINKATVHLAEQGLLVTKMGSGSIVSSEKHSAVKVGMLLDKNRSLRLQDLDEPAYYHSKDIYLSYMLQMNRRQSPSSFVVYDPQCQSIPEETRQELDGFSGFLVQGSLPQVYFEYFLTTGKPAVLINRRVPPDLEGAFGQVLIGEDKIRDAFNYLASLGHRRILFAHPDYLMATEVTHKRFELSLEAAKAAYGTQPFQLKEFFFTPRSEESLSAFKSLMDDGFSASFGFNDVSALGLYSLLHQLGKKIPEDFSVIGFDDIFPSQVAVPPLTTIRVPRNKLVIRALGLLDQLSLSRETTLLSEILETELIIRHSTYMNK